MKLLFFFLDGVGLGSEDPAINPFSRVEMPFLQKLLGNRKLLYKNSGTFTLDASLFGLDACLDVPGIPQSATGQTTIMTGKKIPTLIGHHYGPKPTPEIASHLYNGNLFSIMKSLGARASFVNAFPPGYFKAIETGKRLPGAIAMAALAAQIPLKTATDLFEGRALSADLTGEGWREHLGFDHTPLLTPFQSGQRLVELANQVDLAFFEFWLSDFVGHKQDFETASRILTVLDQAIQGMVHEWDPNDGLILFTSDHGNLEDLSTRRHTLNPVPALLIGDPDIREEFLRGMKDLSDLLPAIVRLLQR